MTTSNDQNLNDETFHALMENQRRLLSMVQNDEAVEFQEHKSRMFTEEQPTDYMPPVDIMIPSGLHHADNPTTRRTQTPAFQLSIECAFEEQPFEKYIVFDSQEEPKITRRIFEEEGVELPLKKRRLSMDTASLTSFEDFEGLEDEEEDDGEDDDSHKIEGCHGAFTISEMPCDATTVSRDEDNDWMNTSASSSSSSGSSSIWGEANLPTTATTALPSNKSGEPCRKMMLKSAFTTREKPCDATIVSSDEDDDWTNKSTDCHGAFTIREMPCDATTVSRDEDNDWINTSTSSSESCIWGEINLPTTTTTALPPYKSRETFRKMMLKSTKSQRQIQDWERRVVGLRRSHSQTMRNSTKTRQALLKNLFAA